MPDYDVLVYHDFSDVDSVTAGDDAAEKFGTGFEGLGVAVVGPPIHTNKDATVVLAFGGRATSDLEAFVYRARSRS